MSLPRVWFITGASSGFGRSMTEHILSIGEIAVATLRSPSAIADLQTKYPTTQLLVLKCDVSIPSDITAAFEETRKSFGRCDVVFNNAGFGTAAEVEGTPVDVARQMFEVNFWGATNVSTAAVKFFREVNPSGKGGTLLVNTSVVGSSPAPTLGFYCASKHALEGVTESFARELHPDWNIHVRIIEPGGFETKGLTHEMFHSPVHPAYTDPSLVTQKIRGYLADPNLRLPGDPAKAVARIVKYVDAIASKEANVPFRWAMGVDAIGQVKAQAEAILKDMEKSAGWNDDLEFDHSPKSAKWTDVMNSA